MPQNAVQQKSISPFLIILIAILFICVGCMFMGMLGSIQSPRSNPNATIPTETPKFESKITIKPYIYEDTDIIKNRGLTKINNTLYRLDNAEYKIDVRVGEDNVSDQVKVVLKTLPCTKDDIGKNAEIALNYVGIMIGQVNEIDPSKPLQYKYDLLDLKIECSETEKFAVVTLDLTELYKNAVDKEKAEARRKKVDKYFSSYDGSNYELVRLVKNSMHDPDSFEHVETTSLSNPDYDYMLVTMEYRGNNAFGAKVLNSTTAKISIETGEIIEILE